MTFRMRFGARTHFSVCVVCYYEPLGPNFRASETLEFRSVCACVSVVVDEMA